MFYYFAPAPYIPLNVFDAINHNETRVMGYPPVKTA